MGKPGRKKRTDIPRELIGHIMTYGETEKSPGCKEDNGRFFPTCSELAERYNVSRSFIQKYSAKHECLEKRENWIETGHPAPRTPEIIMTTLTPPSRHVGGNDLKENQPPESPDDLVPRPLSDQEMPHHLAKLSINDISNIKTSYLFGYDWIDKDGRLQRTYPTTKELAIKYDVKQSTLESLISKWGLRKQRKELLKREEALFQEFFLRKRLEKQAIGADDVLRVIDKFILRFEQAVDGGDVSFTSPSDFEKFVRLREFVSGRNDQRSETNMVITLEGVQDRYSNVIKRSTKTGYLGGMNKQEIALSGILDGASANPMDDEDDEKEDLGILNDGVEVPNDGDKDVAQEGVTDA